jgi:hypothetical protein
MWRWSPGRRRRAKRIASSRIPPIWPLQGGAKIGREWSRPASGNFGLWYCSLRVESGHLTTEGLKGLSGTSSAAKIQKEAQAYLIKSGRFCDAQQMDIDDGGSSWRNATWLSKTCKSTQ